MTTEQTNQNPLPLAPGRYVLIGENESHLNPVIEVLQLEDGTLRFHFEGDRVTFPLTDDCFGKDVPKRIVEHDRDGYEECAETQQVPFDFERIERLVLGASPTGRIAESDDEIYRHAMQEPVKPISSLRDAYDALPKTPIGNGAVERYWKRLESLDLTALAKKFKNSRDQLAITSLGIGGLLSGCARAKELFIEHQQIGSQVSFDHTPMWQHLRQAEVTTAQFMSFILEFAQRMGRNQDTLVACHEAICELERRLQEQQATRGVDQLLDPVRAEIEKIKSLCSQRE